VKIPAGQLQAVPARATAQINKKAFQSSLLWKASNT